MGKSVKKAFSNPIRGLTAIGTFGSSELLRRQKGMIGQVAKLPEQASDSILGTHFANPGAADLVAGPSGQSPTDLLASTGGAPVLANIAMGVNPEDALAGYFGKNKADGSWQEFMNGLSQKDLDSIRSTHQQLATIQGNRELRQQAVDKVIADFPNIATYAAQERKAAGGEFDEVTKGYMDQALNGTAAKFAAGGGLSSGAMNEASARVGAEQGMAKLGYMGDREKFAYDTKANEMNVRLGEVNALRDFQNTMMGGQVQQGFSAQQANIQRQFQGQMQQADMANQRYISDQQSSNSMFNALGSLGGSFIGAKLFGGLGGAGGLFGGGSSAPKTNVPSFTKNFDNGYRGY